MTKSEDELHVAAHWLNNIAKKYNLKISFSKTKPMGMCGNEIWRLKIIIEGKIIEQVTELKYLGNKISKYKKDMEYKLQTCNRMSAIIKRNVGKQMFNEIRLRMHNSESSSHVCMWDMGAK
jgi:hypothetical protein